MNSVSKGMPMKLFSRAESPHPDIITMTAAVDIKATATGEKPGTFSGLAYTGEPMKLEGWQHPTIIDLNGFSAPRQNMPALRDHEFGRIVGHTTGIHVDSTGVQIHGVVSATGPDAKAVTESARNGFPWQLSLGSKPAPKSVEHLPAGKKAVINGREVEGPMTIVRRATMHELSFTPLGADPNTTVAIAASKKGKVMDDTITLENVKTIIGETVKDTIAAMQADELRLMRTCAGRPEILARAQAENWDANRAELEVLRASRPKPFLGTSTGAPDNQQVIEAAMCITAGLSEDLLKDQYDEKVLDAANDKKYRGFGFQSLMRTTIQAAGMPCPATSGDELIRTSFDADRMLKASGGVSNYSLSGTLSNVANKAVVAGFNAVEDTWSRVGNVTGTKDFKTKETYRLSGDFEYKKIGPNGELQHATGSEDKYTVKADTYGRLFAISRQDLINDDLGVLEQTFRLKLGRGAGIAINKVFWTAFMNNGSFFTSGNGSYFSGSTTNLSIDSLTTGEKLFYDQTDAQGDPTNLTPRILLVPNTITALANQLMRSVEIRDTNTNTVYATVNPHAEKFAVERSAYLSNTNFTGYSTTAWYLLSNPVESGTGVIEISFLNGQRMPIVETSSLDFDQLGIQMRGYHDFGVNLQEYRCGVKSKGAA
jgi:hypothetical protein